VTLATLLTVPCELVRRVYAEAPDDAGEQPVVETVVPDALCEVQSQGTREELGGAVQVALWRVFLADGAPLRGWDAVRLADGTMLELEGDAARVASPLTGLAHVELVARSTA